MSTTAIITTDVQHSTTIEARNSIRNIVKEWQDTREFKPLDLQLIADACQDRYRDLVMAAIESGEQTVAIVDLATPAGYKFLQNWIKANGVNRTRKTAHVQRLALGFQTNYDSSCTHYVLSSNGMVANAGHSGSAYALAFYPETIFYGLKGEPVTVKVEGEKEYIDITTEAADEYLDSGETEDGEEYDNSLGGYYYAGPHPEDPDTQVVYETSLPSIPEGLERVGEYDAETDKYIPGTDNPEAREGKTATLFFNAPNDACLKMDDVRLEADYQDFLEMIGPYRAFIAEVLDGKLSLSEIASVLKQWYLRTLCKVGETGTKYGTLSKGGRLNKAEIQAWFLTALPMLLDSVAQLLVTDADGKTTVSIMPQWQKPQGKWKGGISLQNALTAMMVSDENGRAKIAKLLKKGDKLNNSEQAMKARIIVEATPGAASANADAVVTMLVLHGKGKKDPAKLVFTDKYWPQGVDKTDENTVNPWADESTRADGWDKMAPDVLDDGEECLDEITAASAEWAAEILGDNSMLESVQRKADTKRRAKGGPRKKRTTKKKA